MPEELIAQKPTQRRGQSRLLVVDRNNHTLYHDDFRNLNSYLENNPLMVFNDTRVIPAKIQAQIGTREIEILLTTKLDSQLWEALLKGLGKFKPGTVFSFNGSNLKAEFLKRVGDKAQLKFSSEKELSIYLGAMGRMPLPPYIRRSIDTDAETLELDRKRYQTVFATHSGAVAAPTAGLHFTQPQLKILRESYADIARLTLHVGPGTFIPIRNENIRHHKMQKEYFQISPKNWNKIISAKKRKQKILAVGTTTTRVLEAQEFVDTTRKKISGWTNCFIYPGWNFTSVDHLLTNFHLPKSTLFLLVCAFMGKELADKAYEEAIVKKYRFFSYGDAMLIL